MVHTFLMENVSSVRVCVKPTHLVTSQPEHVTMDVVIIGLENFVKVHIPLCFRQDDLKCSNFERNYLFSFTKNQNMNSQCFSVYIFYKINVGFSIIIENVKMINSNIFSDVFARQDVQILRKIFHNILIFDFITI